MTEKYWPVSLLAAMKLPGYPTSARAWYTRVEKEGWNYRRGPGGIRREYLPPAQVAALIAEHTSKPKAPTSLNKDGAPTSVRQARLKRQILGLMASATPSDQVVKLELTLTIGQAKAVFDALAAMDSGAGDA